MITAAPRSVRARVIDKNQHDRLALARGSVRVVRHGIRPESPTDGRLAGIDAGAANTVHPTILLSVVHGAQTLVEEEALFVTLPTRAHDTARPDTARLPVDHPGTACRFE
jgi:dTDP-4-dehydrorhamnose 3,5-epimerase-like enzyme